MAYTVKGMPTIPDSPLTRYRHRLASLHPLLADHDPLELVDVLSAARLVVPITLAQPAGPKDTQPLRRLSAAPRLTEGETGQTSGPRGA